MACAAFATVASEHYLLTRSRYSNPTSTSRPPSPHTAGPAPPRSSCSLRLEYSWQKDGISVWTPNSTRPASCIHSGSLRHVQLHANTLQVAYSLGIYLLNLFLAFISPKFDPSLEQDEGMEDGAAGGLPTKEEEEFRPFVRRLPEFKFWYSTTKAIAISFLCSWFEVFNLPVFWPVLVVYWLILLFLTSTYMLRSNLPSRKGILISNSEATDSAHDQIPLRPFHRWQDPLPWRREISKRDSLPRSTLASSKISPLGKASGERLCKTIDLLFPRISDMCSP